MVASKKNAACKPTKISENTAHFSPALFLPNEYSGRCSVCFPLDPRIPAN